jgi:hypothetical protein
LRQRRKNPLILIMIAIAVLGISIASLVGSSKSNPEDLVERFYKYEQAGDFGSSWELFHSQMQNRLTKDQYIQSRAHVFMQDMNAKDFTFKIGKVKELKQWKSLQEEPSLKNVNKITVYQTYSNSKFGKFTIEQFCYVVKEKGEWKLLWDFNGD